MRQNIKILTKNCCEDLLTFSTRTELREKYNRDTYDSSGLDFVKIPSQYFMDDKVALGTTSKDDCQSSITIFKELINLDKVQANDKRLWTCLTHTIFFDYTKKRWNIDEYSSDDTIISRFHLEGVGIEARMRNAISRLWWTAKVTYDKVNRNDEFELTRLIWEKQDLWTGLMERSFSTYPNVVQGFLEFYNQNKQLKEDQIRLLHRGLNAIGGVKMLPLLSKQEIVDEIKRIAEYGMIATV
jgi:hypothetical protein